MNNPMDSIEQISYLLFLRLLTEKDEVARHASTRNIPRIFSGKWARFAWGNFVTLTGDELFNAIRDAIESFHELPGLSDTGKLLFSRATLKIYDRPTLRAVVQGIHDLDLAAHDGHDFKGDMYEYLLQQALGFRHQRPVPHAAPHHRPDRGAREPTAGPAHLRPGLRHGRLPHLRFTHILRQHTKPADLERGIVDGSLAQAGAMEVPRGAGVHRLRQRRQHGEDRASSISICTSWRGRISRCCNPLTTGFGGAYPGKLFDVILANPPFAGKVQDESILSDLNYKLNTRATELLFLKWFIDHLRPADARASSCPTACCSVRTMRRPACASCF